MIEITDLTKMYGELYALNRLSLKLDKGDVYGFIGPNGAGKTTTMRILATLLTPTYGEASVCGYSIFKGAKEIRRLIGYMPDFFGVYEDLTAREYLHFFAAAYQVPRLQRDSVIADVLALTELTHKIDEPVDGSRERAPRGRDRDQVGVEQGREGHAGSARVTRSGVDDNEAAPARPS